MVPAAIRRTIEIADDDAEVEGALSHEAIREDALAAGLYDAAAIEIGAVDWIGRTHTCVFQGTLGRIENNESGFVAELRSVKAELEQDLVPRTSPTCRAEFCGVGCGLSAASFTQVHPVVSLNLDTNSVKFADLDQSLFADGKVRFLSGPQTGLSFRIVTTSEDGFVLNRPLSDGVKIGTRAELRQGCDHTITTCAGRFGNSHNFRGEPFLPGNDLLARYGRS